MSQRPPRSPRTDTPFPYPALCLSAQGDMGLAPACLAPSAVSNALVLWGDGAQQSTDLPAFVGEHAPVAALAIHEPQPLFDPFALQTIARREIGRANV